MRRKPQAYMRDPFKLGDRKQDDRHAPSPQDADRQQGGDPSAGIEDPGERPRDAGAPPWASSDRDIQDRYSGL
jgi:hypothetical protein